MYINLKLFGGRGGSSGIKGGGRFKEQDGFEALASGTSEEDLNEKQMAQIKEYLEDFLRDTAKLKSGYIDANKYNEYTTGENLEDTKKFIKDLFNYDYDTGDLDVEWTESYWDYDRRISVSYNTSGTKWHYYDFEDSSDFKRLDREIKSGKIKGIVYEDGYETRVAGRGINVVAPNESGSAYFRFDIGKLPKKIKK